MTDPYDGPRRGAGPDPGPGPYGRAHSPSEYVTPPEPPRRSPTWPWAIPLTAIAIGLMWYVLARGEPQSPAEWMPDDDAAEETVEPLPSPAYVPPDPFESSVTDPDGPEAEPGNSPAEAVEVDEVPDSASTTE